MKACSYARAKMRAFSDCRHRDSDTPLEVPFISTLRFPDSTPIEYRSFLLLMAAVVSTAFFLDAVDSAVTWTIMAVCTKTYFYIIVKNIIFHTYKPELAASPR